VDEADALLHLALIPGLGPLHANRLVTAAGSASAVPGLGMERLVVADGVGGERARRICDQRAEERVARERADAHLLKVRIVARGEPDYPAALLALADPPLALWMRGSLEPRDRLAVALAGSRRPSAYAHRQAHRLALALARFGTCLVGGLARGIDTVAHEAALSAGARTIAVLGSGFQRLYPAENQPLLERICDGRGAVLSEFPLHAGPSATTFPQRNRLIAALVLATVVVEAGLRASAVALARLSGELGREVMALPGRIDDPECAGSNRLIRDGATLVTGVEDVLEEVAPLATLAGAHAVEAPGRDRLGSLTGRERQVYQLLDERARTVEDLARVTTVPASSLAAAMLSLELKRLVKKAGAGYVRAT
jgi:DNA processing protein